MMLGGNDTRHIPLGDSGAAALVVSVLYLAGAAAIILNWQKTGFHYYKALISSTALRSVAFAVRAVYLLGPFKPALVGVFMALSNAGWGANVSAMCLVTACWMEHSKTKFHPLEHTVYRRTFYFWVVVLVLVGPSIGFLAAGLLYGTVSGRLEAIGQNLQAISSWAILVVTAVLWILLCRIAGRALFIEETSDHEHPAEEKHKRLLGDPSAHTDKPTRSENLMGILWICATLGLFRSIMGVICTYPVTKHLYTNDRWYYPLFQLPELLILAICATPTLLARISLVYPSPDAVPEPSDAEAGASGGGDDY